MSAQLDRQYWVGSFYTYPFGGFIRTTYIDFAQLISRHNIITVQLLFFDRDSLFNLRVCISMGIGVWRRSYRSCGTAHSVPLPGSCSVSRRAFCPLSWEDFTSRDSWCLFCSFTWFLFCLLKSLHCVRSLGKVLVLVLAIMFYSVPSPGSCSVS